MENDLILEVVVDSIESAIAAEKGGASRVELCANLFEGGTTPSAGCIEITRKYIKIGLFIMIRPRGGDFCYSAIEFEQIKKDIAVAKSLGADGIVFGILTKDGQIDTQRTNELALLAYPLPVTFHRAFDMTADPIKALHDLIELKNITRILTSGQEVTAYEGAELISKLVQEAKNRIIIMPGSGVNERNISKIRKITGAWEYHASSRVKMDSQMSYRNPNTFMGGALRLPEFEISMTDATRIQAIKAAGLNLQL
jgi:copper homeostasis protein